MWWMHMGQQYFGDLIYRELHHKNGGSFITVFSSSVTEVRPILRPILRPNTREMDKEVVYQKPRNVLRHIKRITRIYDENITNIVQDTINDCNRKIEIMSRI